IFSAFKSVSNIRRDETRVSFLLDGLAITDRLTPPKLIEREADYKNLHIRAIFTLDEIPQGTKFSFSADITTKGFLRFVVPLVKRKFRTISKQNVADMKKAAEAGTNAESGN
ncbi:MAG: hypothetical protein HY619_02015, partial [Thaumarchaeota archaeon]|nr:hypothetical protein [Nitrososphaerota archaeon]